jgi:O-acetyl-ADP-ribose deacetylase (regulator of RNase III)
VFTWEANDRVIYNLATQPRPGPSATLEAIHQSVSLALDDADRRGLTKLGLPRLGAGLGGLDWPHVLGTLGDASRSHPTELIVVSLPNATG